MSKFMSLMLEDGGNPDTLLFGADDLGKRRHMTCIRALQEPHQLNYIGDKTLEEKEMGMRWVEDKHQLGAAHRFEIRVVLDPGFCTELGIRLECASTAPS